ncbi:MAG: hypothetical protein Q8M15_14295 [Bacteroidota bacterium]|nr:hypothetical protein [Bacteroidota bacterium]
MKKAIIILFSGMLICSNFFAVAQNRPYTTKSGEFIFSFANYKVKNAQVNTPLRFTCFFHASTLLHIDFNNHVGIYTGLGIRNVGFISENVDTLIKRRNYYVGIPLAIKLGNLGRDSYLYAGLEGELGLNYKEKMFINEAKINKFNAWFSDRTPLFMPSAFVGLNLKSGFNLKFKYYFYNFLEKGYDYTLNNVKVYQTTESRIFYFSLAYNVRNTKKFKRAFNKET